MNIEIVKKTPSLETYIVLKIAENSCPFGTFESISCNKSLEIK